MKFITYIKKISLSEKKVFCVLFTIFLYTAEIIMPFISIYREFLNRSLEPQNHFKNFE